MANGPTIRRRRIARELRQLRNKAELTLDQAATRLDMSKSNLSRIENAEIGAKPRDVRAFLAVYGVVGDEAEVLVGIARGARERGWWQSYTDVMPEGFEFYVGLEADASVIRTYEAEAVPGLLQTADYARAITVATFTGDVDRVVAARLERQKALQDRPAASAGDQPSLPAILSVILNEAVLLRPVGGADVMKRQLDHLVGLTDLENVEILVLPFAAGAHAVMSTSYIVLTFPDATEDPIVYMSNLTQSVALEEQEHVQRYDEAHTALCQMSLSPAESVERLRQAVRDLA